MPKFTKKNKSFPWTVAAAKAAKLPARKSCHLHQPISLITSHQEQGKLKGNPSAGSQNWNEEQADELSELQIHSQCLAIVTSEMWLYLTPRWIYLILKENTFFFFTPLKSYDVIFSWQMSWFKFWDAWKYFLNSLSGSLQLQLHCYNKSCNAVLYGPYFPFNRHSGNILKRFCVRYVLSEPKPLHAKYADWNFCAKLEENTMFDLCLECSVYWLRFCVAILWKNDLTINELEKLLHMWPSFNECTEISGLLWVLGNLWCLTIPLENDFTWGARNAWTQILQSPQWNPKKCSQS